MIEGKKAILFDLDGTLWDVTDETYKSVNSVAAKHNLGAISKNVVRSVFGCNRVEAAQIYFPNVDFKDSINLMEEISEDIIKNLKKNGGNIYPNLEQVLIKLTDNYKLFIVSNTGHSAYIKAFLTTSNFEKYFVDFIAASELKISKAEGINKIINDYGIDKSIYVGDTKKDCEASKAANIPFIQALYGFGENLKTEYSINSVNELPDVVSKIL